MIDSIGKMVVNCENLSCSELMLLAGVKKEVPVLVFERIASFEVKRAIVTAILMYADTNKIEFNIRRINEYIEQSTLKNLESIKSVFDDLCHVEKEFAPSTRKSCFRDLKRGIFLADLIYRKGSKKEIYIQHCVYFEKLDMIGLELLLCDFEKINFSRLEWYRELSGLTSEAQEAVAEFFYHSLSTELYAEWSLFKNAFYLEEKIKNSEGLCTLEKLFTLLSDEITRGFGITFRFHWMYTQIEKDSQKIYSFDIWKYDWFIFGRNAENKSDWTGGDFFLNFTKLKDDETRYIVQKYIYYLLNVESLAFDTISETLRTISIVYSDLGLLLHLTQQQTIDYCANKYTLHRSETDELHAEDYVARIISTMSKFFDWCCSHEILSENVWLFVRKHYSTRRNRIVKKAISAYVLQQIFYVLVECPDERMRIIFLIIFDTGLRGEDATALTKDSLVIKGETVDGKFKVTGGYLYYKNHKFSAEKRCVILSPSVAILLDEYRQQRIQNDDSPFLFPRYDTKSKHIVAATFRQYMTDFFIEKGIKEEDGAVFRFKVHGLRHTAAERMRKAGVPIEVISAQLNHQSIEMTMRYLDDFDDDLLKQNKTYVDVNGASVDEKMIGNKKDFEMLEDAYIKMKQMLLPNGFCRRPQSLKSCPHYCTCISGNCQYFRTDLSYLGVLEQQLFQEKQLLENCSSAPEIKTHKKKAILAKW